MKHLSWIMTLALISLTSRVTLAEAPNAFMTKLQPHLLSSGGEAVAGADVAGAKQTLLYYSASWCGPCKKFTPNLVKEYEGLRAAGIQVVLVNRDRDQATMLKYMSDFSQPWPGISPEAQDKIGVDFKSFASRGIPCLALIDADGKLVDKGIAWDTLPRIVAGTKP